MPSEMEPPWQGSATIHGQNMIQAGDLLHGIGSLSVYEVYIFIQPETATLRVSVRETM